MDWIITNIKKGEIGNHVEGDSYINNIDFTKSALDPQLELYVEGNIIPRQSVYEDFKFEQGVDLIAALNVKYGDDFIHYIKGIFIIIIKTKGIVKIFTDRHSIKKAFYWIKKDEYIFSNSIDLINTHISPVADLESLALFCIMEHFVLGYTAFKNVYHSLPASAIVISNDIKISRYWLPQELFRNRKVKKPNFDVLTTSWQSLISSYLEYFKSSEVSITITGGIDSRMVLAALLKSEANIKAFTYGNPDSIDCIIAKEIAKKSAINYSVYSSKNFDNSGYSELTDEIDEFSNTLINLHRAHRLDAIKKNYKENPNSKLLFSGLMGGEYIKGIQYDDYIIPRFIRLFEESGREKLKQIVEDVLKDCRIELKEIDINRLVELIQDLDILKEDNRKNREFLYSYYLYGCAHHSQDSTIFKRYSPVLVNPFMDIDWLELLAEHHILSFQHSRKGIIFKLFNSKSQVIPTHLLAPYLSDIPYAKKGFYTANDLLGNPLIYIAKRLLKFKESKNYPPNFSYGSWFYSYCKSEFNIINPIIQKLFNFEQLQLEMKNDKEIIAEGKWHKFTNPINLSRVLNKYEKV